MPANYVLISEQTVNVPVASVTLSNIPQTGYTDLKLVISARATTSANWVLVGINGGSDTASTLLHLLNNGGSVITQTYTSLRAMMTTSSQTANTFSNSELYFTNYASTTANKSISGDGTQEDIAGNVNQQSAGFRWPFNTAISSLTLTVDGGGSFVAGSTFSLYGIAAFGTEPTVVPLASGGDIVVNDGTYWYHAFLASGFFVPQTNLSCDYLVVAGGGGGSTNEAGGGGGGGLRSTVTATGGGGTLETALTLSTDTIYTVTVGAGGAAAGTQGIQGSSSVFSTITTVGGGGGGNGGQIGGAGGSGGGGGAYGSNAGGARTVNQGFAGGNGSVVNGGAGGGGGAGAVGVNGTGSTAGNGGAGVAISAFASATNTGVSNFYAGGGGGGAFSGSTQSTGGAGGGGAGGAGTPTVGTAGTVNTGSGGGGGGTGGAIVGGAGGSGIVIVRYTMA